MKRAISFLAALVLLWSGVFALTAGAEGTEWTCGECGTENTGSACEACGAPRQIKLTYDQRNAVRSALISALDMKARAMNGSWTETQQRWADSIASIDATHPRAGVILKIRGDAQQQALRAWLGDADYFWPEELNKKLNAIYSEDYAEVAGRIAVNTGTGMMLDDPEGILAVLLVYDRDLVLSWTRDGFELYGMCVIGSESVAAQFGEEYVMTLLASLGLQGAEVVLLPTAGDIEAVKDDAVMPLYPNEKEMADSVTGSSGSVLAMLPELYGSGLFTQVSVGATIVLSYLEKRTYSHEEALKAVTFVHEQLEPAVDAYGYGKPGFWKSGVYMSYPDALLKISKEWVPPVELEGGVTDAETDAEPLKDGGKILAVHRRTTTSGQVTVKIQYFLQAYMDEQYNPGSPEEADYILLVDTHWEEDEPHGDIRLFKGVSVVTLNDAKTGKVLMNIGTRKDGAYGMITVYGNAYYQDPRLEGLWNDTIAPALFPEKK